MSRRYARAIELVARSAPYALCILIWRLANRAMWDPSPSSLMKEGPWLAAVVMALACIRLVNLDPRRPPPPPSARAKPTWEAGIAAASALAALGYWHWQLVRDMRMAPIASEIADMLPLMQAGFADLDARLSPYRPHFVPWRLTNYYLPSTFLPYYAASKLGVDIRWVTIVSIDGVFGALALLVPFRSNRRTLVRGFLAWLAVVTLLGVFVVGRNHFAAFVQLGPYWLYVAIAFVALVRQRPAVSACALGLILAAREPGVFLTALPLAHLTRVDGGRPRYPLIALGVALAMFAPFLASDPLFWLGNLAQYSSFDVADTVTRHVGLAGIMHMLGVPYLRWPLFGLLLGSVFYAARRRISDALFVTKAAGVIGILFALCAPITWEYTFVEGLVVLGIYCIARLSHPSCAARG